jgi:hypothetical protein
MKTLLKIFGGVVVCLIVLLVILRITGLEPHNRTPGLWLKGNVVTVPVSDWSFTNQVPNIKLQTESWYGLPHSVTIDCVSYDGHLYVSSVLPAGTTHAWNENAMRDPHVRIQIGNNLYDRNLSLVTDPAEQQAVLQARSRKYPQLKVPASATINIFRVVG